MEALTKLVTVQGQGQEAQLTTTSRIIADLYGKQHKNILRAIENLECSEAFTQLNFEPSEYVDSTGRTLKEYTITRAGAMYLVCKFTGEKAARATEMIIQAFEYYENVAKNMQVTLPPNLQPIQQMLNVLAEQNRQIETNTAHLKLVTDSVSKGSLTEEQVSQVIEAINDRIRYLRIEGNKHKIRAAFFSDLKRKFLTAPITGKTYKEICRSKLEDVFKRIEEIGLDEIEAHLFRYRR